MIYDEDKNGWVGRQLCMLSGQYFVIILNLSAEMSHCIRKTILSEVFFMLVNFVCITARTIKMKFNRFLSNFTFVRFVLSLNDYEKKLFHWFLWNLNTTFFTIHLLEFSMWFLGLANPRFFQKPIFIGGGQLYVPFHYIVHSSNFHTCFCNLFAKICFAISRIFYPTVFSETFFYWWGPNFTHVFTSTYSNKREPYAWCAPTAGHYVNSSPSVRDTHVVPRRTRI